MINTLKLPFLCGPPHERMVRSAPGQSALCSSPSAYGKVTPRGARQKGDCGDPKPSCVLGSHGGLGEWGWEGDSLAWSGLPLQGWEVWGFDTTGEKTGRSGEWTNARNHWWILKLTGCNCKQHHSPLTVSVTVTWEETQPHSPLMVRRGIRCVWPQLLYGRVGMSRSGCCWTHLTVTLSLNSRVASGRPWRPGSQGREEEY